MIKECMFKNRTWLYHGLATIIGGITYFIFSSTRPQLLEGTLVSMAASISFFILVSLFARLIIFLLSMELEDKGGYYY